MNAERPAGAPVDAMLAQMEEDLDQGLIPLKVFNNREIYDAELRRLFARNWVFIGHETELKNNGDYAQRYIGEDPFIFVRDQDGIIRVLFNACRHRGVQVCRAEMGNATHFNCPYHGWLYKTSGELEAVPVRSHGYRQLDLKEWGLFAAPHVTNYHGLIFANLDPDAIPFEEHLGSYKWYLDLQFALSPGGMEVVGEPQRWVIEANWKQGAENFTGDSSHTQMVHRSVIESGLSTAAAVGAPGRGIGLHIHDIDGHSISTRVQDEGTVFWNYPEEVTRHFNADRITADQFDFARRSKVHDGTLFPNFSYLHIGLTDAPERPVAGFLIIRVWQPKGPGRTEVWNWIMVPKEAPPEYKLRAADVAMSTFSASGSFDQDDVTVWPGIQRSARTVFAEMNDIKCNYQMGMPGMSNVEPKHDFYGPGEAMESNAGEGGLRCFHRTWLKQMKAGRG